MSFEEEVAWVEMHNAGREAAIDEAAERCGVQLSPLERSAVGLFVGSMADVVAEHLPEADTNLSLLADLAGFAIGNPLWLKLLTGMSAELYVADHEIANGLVGRAVEEAVEALRPYWESKLAGV
ncbi:MAG TPA: hypothetical protein VFL72_00235 [Acidimicrobiia bacterium]|nr:hypothetical protein [Acidimicrobiia bacterium]